MGTQWEGRISGKERSAWGNAFTVARTAEGTAISEATGPVVEAQEEAAKQAVDLLLDALGIQSTDTNFQVAASGFDNGQAGALHEAAITISVQKHLA